MLALTRATVGSNVVTYVRNVSVITSWPQPPTEAKKKLNVIHSRPEKSLTWFIRGQNKSRANRQPPAKKTLAGDLGCIPHAVRMNTEDNDEGSDDDGDIIVVIGRELETQKEE